MKMEKERLRNQSVSTLVSHVLIPEDLSKRECHNVNQSSSSESHFLGLRSAAQGKACLGGTDVEVQSNCYQIRTTRHQSLIYEKTLNVTLSEQILIIQVHFQSERNQGSQLQRYEVRMMSCVVHSELSFKDRGSCASLVLSEETLPFHKRNG